MKIGYTTVMHEPRVKLGLTMNEYSLLDLIYRLSTNPMAPVKGWCSMSKQGMADFLGVSKRTVISICNKLSDDGLLEKSVDGRLYKTTNHWVKNVVDFHFTHGEETAPSSGEESSLTDGEETAPYNYIIENNKRERETRALDFLKINFPSRFETEFQMRYQTRIRDPEKFALDFDDTVTQEKLDYDAALFGRLGKYARNWIENQDRYNKNEDQPGPILTRLVD